MDLRLKGKRALVTGSNTGIGAGIARLLIEEGCSVFVHGRNRERAEKTAAEIGAAGYLAADIGTDEGADALCKAAKAALGGSIEILVNNAGGATKSGSATREPLQIGIEDWLEAYQINTLAAVRMILRATPDMVAAKWGRIINISSSGGVMPPPRGADYNGAKAAINNLSVGLARSLKGVGVTVNTVSPGIIVTPSLGPIMRVRYIKERGWPEDITDEEVPADRPRGPRPAGRMPGRRRGHRSRGLHARQPARGLYHRRELPRRRRADTIGQLTRVSAPAFRRAIKSRRPDRAGMTGREARA
jgi:NAD(P)-dependent dehydrogenase (short-subunit alcohol dehydrogenase family)